MSGAELIVDDPRGVPALAEMPRPKRREGRQELPCHHCGVPQHWVSEGAVRCVCFSCLVIKGLSLPRLKHTQPELIGGVR